MPVYNGGKYIKEAIQSVLGQTYKDFELLIIDDGSTDYSIEIAESFPDERIKIIKLNHNGIVEALNKGLGYAQGEYVIRSDADDVSMPDRFQKLLEYMDGNKDVSVCGSWATTINENGENIGELKYSPVEDYDIRKYAVFHNPFIHPSVIFRTEEVKRAGGYKNFTHTEDYELWTRLLKKGKGYNISEKLVKYRIHSKQITRSNNTKMRVFGLFVRILAIVRLLL